MCATLACVPAGSEGRAVWFWKRILCLPFPRVVLCSLWFCLKMLLVPCKVQWRVRSLVSSPCACACLCFAGPVLNRVQVQVDHMLHAMFHLRGQSTGVSVCACVCTYIRYLSTCLLLQMLQCLRNRPVKCVLQRCMCYPLVKAWWVYTNLKNWIGYGLSSFTQNVNVKCCQTNSHDGCTGRMSRPFLTTTASAIMAAKKKQSSWRQHIAKCLWSVGLVS